MGYPDYGYTLEDEPRSYAKDYVSTLRGLRHPLSDPSLVREFLAQETAWLPADGAFVRIKDMTPAHALAAANYVLDRARSVCLVLLAAGDERSTEIVVANDQMSRLVLLDTELVQALVQRGRESVAAVLPWAALAR